MFEVGVVGHFEARHHLVGDFGPASEPHAHEYRIEATVTGSELKADGTLLDITVLQSALSSITTTWSGRNLNDAKGLAQPNPTAEVLARAVWNHLADALQGHGLTTLQVRVWESDEACAAYADEL